MEENGHHFDDDQALLKFIDVNGFISKDHIGQLNLHLSWFLEIRRFIHLLDALGFFWQAYKNDLFRWLDNGI